MKTTIKRRKSARRRDRQPLRTSRRRSQGLSQSWLEAVQFKSASFAQWQNWDMSWSTASSSAYMGTKLIYKWVSAPEGGFNGVKAKMTPTWAQVQPADGENDMFIGLEKDNYHATCGIFHVSPTSTTHKRYFFIELDSPDQPPAMIFQQLPTGPFFNISIEFYAPEGKFTFVCRNHNNEIVMQKVFSDPNWVNEIPTHAYFGGGTVHTDSHLMNNAKFEDAQVKLANGSWIDAGLHTAATYNNDDPTHFSLTDVIPDEMTLTDSRGD